MSTTNESDVLRSAVRAPSVYGGRKPEEIHIPAATNIHDDETAQRLGFRGGTIAGSIHMDQFPPLLVEAFGQRWFETGSLSLQFKNATVEGEEVVAAIDAPSGASDEQVNAWTEALDAVDGALVAQGTASVGNPSESTYLHSLDLRLGDPATLRILHDVQPGTPFHHTEALGAAAAWMTAPIFGDDDWYQGPSPWGGAIANPSGIVQLLRFREPFTPHIKDAVGLFGAIEIRFHAGPVFRDTTYDVTGSVVGVGDSPKSEYCWYDSHATDPDGRLVVSMRMQSRWMKASSPLYAE
jgi:hypothetical protein